ncbi:translation elongation factor Ts [Planctomycetota bacterium]
MAEISASAVMELRKMSGQGMMDCKKALGETAGDVEAAMELLRKKGLATLAKRAGRETSEGLVVTQASDDGKTVALVSLCCETDFVAKSEGFVAVAETLGNYAIACEDDEGAGAVLETEIDGTKFSKVLTDAVSQTGEKTEVGDYAKFQLDGTGLISTYIHFNKKIGTMVQVDTSDDSVAGSDVLRQAANDIAMHITATKPMSLDESGIDAKTVEHEKAIFAEQMKGKPENIIGKIVEGKMKKFFAENCLLAQPFVKDDSKTVGQFIADAGKQAGGEAKVVRFVCFSVGE